MTRVPLVAALVAAAATVAGCMHMRPGGDGLTFEQRRVRLESLASWEMRGRLAVDTAERGGFQGRFEWRQEDDRLRLLVRGPLGAGVLQVVGTPQEALTVTARGETWTLGDPEAELSAMLGWWLPVTSLSDWLLGLPDPGFRARAERGADGVLESLEQRLWQLDYVAYQLREGVLIPRRIDMSHGELKLRLTVDTWRPVAAAGAS